jgi:hypothetical protein
VIFAKNPALFGDAKLFGEPVKIQPRLLTANEKSERWSKLWGTLEGVQGIREGQSIEDSLC